MTTVTTELWNICTRQNSVSILIKNKKIQRSVQVESTAFRDSGKYAK